MKFTSDKFITDIVDIICNNEDVKNNIKSLFKPLLQVLLKEVYPYIWFSLIVIFTLLIFNIVTIFMLFQIKNNMKSV